MARYRFRTYDAAGARMDRSTHGYEVDDSHGDGPTFFAHQLLHVDGVVCVAIWDAEAPEGAEPILTRCDPGLEFADVVRQP